MIQFKSIKLTGFKSFADKTEIPLSEGVTCIVGPNGCGKSNVADAIRWVLGEQSAKQMRGTQMMDVIFGGTEKRKKMSFCEVTLTFDNTNRIFDIDCDEVEMTRRLYRDGESEYILNRQPSRMKTLTALLHGAGAAKEGYSIIGQGRIAQIMNSRPEERRSIFEEATGIVIFKDRKADAERKLSAARDNLFVFAQRMQEVERQLAPLSRAAENARKYRELYSNLRLHEVNAYIYRHDTAEGERNKIKGKSDKLKGKLEEMSALSSDLLKQYDECRTLIASADAKLKSLYDKKVSYSVGLAETSGESRVFKEKANSVKVKLQQAQEDIVFSTKRIGDIDREIKRTEEYARRNLSRLENLKAEGEKLRGEIATLSAAIADYEYMTGEHRKKVLDTFKDLSEMKESIGSLAAKKELLNERLDEISAAMENIRAERDLLKDEYDRAVERQNTLNNFLGEENTLTENAEAAVRAADEKLQLAVRKIYDTEAYISSQKQSLKTYQALRDRFEGYVYSVRRLMSDSKDNSELSSRIMGLIADVVSTSPDYEVAIETAFGGAMQNVITSTRDDAKYLIKYLKNNRAGQVTFLPVEALRPRYENEQIKSAVRERGAIGYAIDLVQFDKKYENVIHNLLGNTLICDGIDSATQIAGRYPRAFKIVTLDGDVISTSGSMTGGSRRENSANLLANERKLKEIEDDISLKQAYLERMEKNKSTAEDEKVKAETARDELRERLQSAKLELAAAAEKQAGTLVNVTGKESEYAAYAQSRRALEQKLAELDDQYSSTSKGASSLSEQSDKASSEMDDMSEKYEKLSSERNAKTERFNSCQVEIASLESGVKSNTDSVARLNAERAELISKVASLQERLPEMQSAFDDFTEKAARAALSKEDKAALDEVIGQIEELESTKKTLDSRTEEVNSKRLETYEEIENTKEKLHAQELALQKVDSDLENLQTRITEEYGLDYEGCLEYREENYDISTSASNIASYKRQLTMLGAVNPNAVEEYEEVSARYNKMCEEKADLEKGIEDLTFALNEIRDEMLKIFNAGFDTINENFKRTFKELFGGGKAELQLDYTDCDDPLNAGVEIVACPPGKKLTKISLLSGGEQALTAIAILFAIIAMRPMPFCVLDEIEAALDEANVSRYAKYLKKFAKDTQFIVITHRKPTMENADVLFGVTMEEKGVSKIVSVKLSEVETRLGGDTVA
ncbi:MAG: chromosome segregation protein SMC [Candidatus Coproplasma sp.]